MSRTSSFSVRLADVMIRFRWWVLLFSLLGTFLVASGARHLAFSTSYRAFFSKDNPELAAFDELQATFTKTDNLLFVIHNPKGSVFEPKTVEAITWLTEEAWQIPFNTRVDSIANFQHTWSEEDDLTVERLLDEEAELTPEFLKKREAIALAEPLLAGNLISLDADTTGVNVTLNLPEKSITETPEVAAAAREIADRFREAHPDLTLAISGLVMLNNAFSESGEKDSQTLIPLMYLSILIIMALLLRSVSATIATLVVILFATLVAMGVGGYMNVKLTPISVSSTTIILTLAVADSIHILVSMRNLLRAGMEKRDAIREAIRINFIPVSVTSLTTIIGFLALNFSETPPFHDLGNLTSVGIAAAWMLSLTTLPALMAILPWKVKTRTVVRTDQAFLPGYVNWLIARPKQVLAIVGLLVVGTMLFLPRVELNDEWVKYFDHRVEFRNDTEFLMEHLSGLYALQLGVPAKEGGGISDPEYLNHLESFTAWLREQDEIKHVYSYSDIVKRLNKNMHGDNPGYYSIPKDRDLAAQYLLLYEMSLPQGLDLNDRIDIDKATTRVTATIPEISTKQLRGLLNRCETWLADNTPAYMHTKCTGPSAMFAFVSERNIHSMLTGNVIAILLISLVITLSLLSWKIGLLSLIPNSVPILVSFGLWGMLVGQVGMAAATVTAVSLGIVVDDTVHFLSKFLLARREKNATRQQAVRYAFNTVGPALLITSTILMIGFSVLTYSTFKINAEMGLLTAMTIVGALIFDFTVLPALLLLGKKETATGSEPTLDAPALLPDATPSTPMPAST